MKFDNQGLLLVWIPWYFYRKKGVRVQGRGQISSFSSSSGRAASDLTEEKKVPSNSSYYDDVSFDNLDWGNSALLALEVPERPKQLKLRKGLAVAHVFFIPF